MGILIVYFASLKSLGKFSVDDWVKFKPRLYHLERECIFTLRSEAENSIRIDSHPHSIAVGDFNHDGLLDIVVPNSGTHNIGVFLRKNNETFKDQMVYSTGPRSMPYAVAVADFDNDQRLDIAVANFGANNVGIFLGTGNGTFKSPTMFSTNSSRPRWIAVGDFNQDKFLDIAVANDGTNNVGVLRGDGKGSFANWTTFSTGFDSMPYALAVADVNHDDRLDIVVANSGTRNVGVLLGLGDGSFAGHTTFDIDHSSVPYSIAVADLNNDTHRDIIVVCTNADHVALLLGSGNGSFALTKKYSTGNSSSPKSVAIGDFDNDTKVDIAVGTDKTSSVIVYFGHGNGSFSYQVVFYTSKDSHPYSIVAGDFNNDARLDIAVVNYDYNYVDIVLTYRNYSFSSPSTYLATGYTSKPRSIAVADFNKDGRSDILIANYATGGISVFLNNGRNVFRQQIIHFGGDDSRPLSLAVADFNNDSRLDFVVANFKGNSIRIFLGNGNGTFLKPTTILIATPDFRPRAVCVGDLNNDSRLDIVVAHQNDKSIGIFYGSGNGRFSREEVKSTDDGYPDIEIPDVPTDGNSGNSEIPPPTDGGGYGSGGDSGKDPFSIEDVYASNDGSGPVWVGIADFNSDNRLDIAVVNSRRSTVGLFLAQQNNIFSYQTAFSIGIGAGPNGAAMGDLNGDGRMDIVVNIYYNRAFQILLSNGNGTFTSPSTYSVGSLSRPTGCTIADWNNDQRLDIIVNSCETNTILVFIGRGDGTFLRERPYFTGNDACPYATAAGDFNNDGLLDIAVVDVSKERVGIFLESTYMNGVREATYTTGSSAHPQAIGLGHFTDKIQLDIIVANNGLGNVGFLQGHPNAIFPSQETFSTGVLSFPTSIAIADFNRDSQLDIVVANSLAGNVGILYGYGKGNFSRQKIFPTGLGSPPQAVSTGDFNNDKKLDIAVAYAGRSGVSTMLRYSSTVLTKKADYFTGESSYPHAVAVGDFNKDGWSDFVTVNRGSGSISVFLGLGNATFSEPATYEVGKGSPSYSLVVGHFNNDTHLDIVVSHFWTDAISILLGLGNGTFSNPKTYPTDAGCSPIGVAKGDFDNDHHLDVAVACNFADSNIGVFLGRGDGTFSYMARYSTGTGAYSIYVAVADFNNDTHLDIVVTNFKSSNIQIFKGSAKGTFEKIRELDTGLQSSPRPVAVADLDNDGHMDIVVGNSGSDDVRVFFGAGDVSFPHQMTYPIESGSLSYGIVIHDFNNDGRLDIGVANYGKNSVTILLALVDRTFFNPVVFATGDNSQPSYLAVADFNNDSRPDIVTASSGIDGPSVFLGSIGEDFLIAPAYSIGSKPQLLSIAVGDFDNDTRLDVVVADNATNNIIVVFGSGYGAFIRHTAYSTGNNSGPCSVAVGDFNKDGRLDIVVANSGDGSIAIFLANGTGTFLNRTVYSTGSRSQPYSVAVLDIDNDGQLDIAVANYGANSVGIFLGHGNGSFSNQMAFDTGFGSHPFALAVGDVNNDNLTDVVAANNGYGNIDILMKTC